MDGEAFLAYVEQVLAPELSPGETVIMDNLPAHKVHGVKELLRLRAPNCATFRLTRQTSIQSRWHFRNSRPFYAPLRNARWADCGKQSPKRLDCFKPKECENYFAAAGYDAV